MIKELSAYWCILISTEELTFPLLELGLLIRVLYIQDRHRPKCVSYWPWQSRCKEELHLNREMIERACLYTWLNLGKEFKPSIKAIILVLTISVKILTNMMIV